MSNLLHKLENTFGDAYLVKILVSYSKGLMLKSINHHHHHGILNQIIVNLYMLGMTMNH